MAAKGLYCSDRLQPLGLHLGLALDKRTWEREMKRLNCEADWVGDDPAKKGSLTTLRGPDGNLVAIVSLSPAVQEDPTHVIQTLVHESVHVWQKHLQEIGEKNPGDEQSAYGIQFVFMNLFDKYAARRDR